LAVLIPAEVIFDKYKFAVKMTGLLWRRHQYEISRESAKNFSQIFDENRRAKSVNNTAGFLIICKWPKALFHQNTQFATQQ